MCGLGCLARLQKEKQRRRRDDDQYTSGKITAKQKASPRLKNVRSAPLRLWSLAWPGNPFCSHLLMYVMRSMVAAGVV